MEIIRIERHKLRKVAGETLGAAFSLVAGASLAANEFEGYASVFDTPIDAWMPTVIERGAFTKTLAERSKQVKILWQHDPDCPIGKPTMMEETAQGLHVRGKISETEHGKECLMLMRDEVIDSLSIGFDPIRFEMVKHEDDGQMWRHIKEVRLYEFSPVTFPANAAAKITNVNEQQGQDKLFQAVFMSLSALPLEIHEGKVLSSKNKGLVSEAIQSLDSTREVLQALLDAAEPPAPPPTGDTQALTANEEKLAELREVQLALLQSL